MNRLTRHLGSFLCLFGFHEWQRWRTLKNPLPVVPQAGTPAILAESMMSTGAVRERRCKWCAKIERRPFKTRPTKGSANV